jgi:hypothetical protein
VSTSVISGLGVRRGVADRLLDHHRAYYRPRTLPPPPAPRPVVRPPIGVRTVLEGCASATVLAGVRTVLVRRAAACLVVWVASGAVYGVCQLGDALVPSRDQNGAVICGTTDPVGSVPGC